MELQDFFQSHPRAALAFSGGVDSSFLLFAGLRAGAEIRPYFVRSPFQPQFELDDARRLALQAGVELTVLERDILENSAVAANGPDRCYHCKRDLFAMILARAAGDGFSLLLDGTNASDDAADRPGMKALEELQVRSPLRECGLTKDRIRQLSREWGLFTWDKPAYACLATRVPTGTALDAATLRRVEKAEGALFDLGFTDFRVRLFHGAARLQMPQGQMEKAAAQRGEILARLRGLFDVVLLDLEGR